MKSLKLFELQYALTRPFLPHLYCHVTNVLRTYTRQILEEPVRILDVGGRKSHYTIGIKGEVTISDLPRESVIQTKLHLGVTDTIVQQTRKRRSNIINVIYDDMVDTQLPRKSFDLIVAVEVLEHVEADEAFIENVSKVLTSTGIFIMTTPNGDYITEISNPDHKRHYRREQLRGLLARHFEKVEVYYAVKESQQYYWGLHAWSLKKPLQSIKSAIGNMLNHWQSLPLGIRSQSLGTQHLVAITQNPLGQPPNVSLGK